jgi:hypothetical protein
VNPNREPYMELCKNVPQQALVVVELLSTAKVLHRIANLTRLQLQKPKHSAFVAGAVEKVAVREASCECGEMDTQLGLVRVTL